jgi:hypothetical protein
MSLNAINMKDIASTNAQCVTDCTTLLEIAKSWRNFLPRGRNSTVLS